jgi:hypothetical protein
MRRLLILSHRYLGIPLSVAFVVWFISGIVMIYTQGFPTISDDDRRAALQPIDIAAVRLSAEAAWVQAGMSGAPGGVRLNNLLGRPAWTYDLSFGRELRIFADNGEVLNDLSAERGAAVAAAWLNIDPSKLQFAETLIEPDQWTLLERRALPMHRYVVNDPAATRIYVSTLSGDVALVTTRKSRFFAWIGVIPHWLYFRPLRIQQPLWYWSIVVLSALGCVLTAMGIVMIFTQFRWRRPISLKRSVRYRGWKRWHYFSGALFGVFALTWVFSGLLSVEPFAWMQQRGIDVSADALTGHGFDLGLFPEINATSEAGSMLAEHAAIEVEYAQVLSEPYLFVTPQGGRRADRILFRAHGFTTAEVFETDSIIDAMEVAAYDSSVVSAELLEEYDAYYYGREGEPLPVLRLKFDDPMNTWYYVDPAAGRIVWRTDRVRRIRRWLFDGLHSLDFAFWYDRRPLWDVGMIALSLGALLTSAIGMFLGFRRLLPAKVRHARN